MHKVQIISSVGKIPKIPLTFPRLVISCSDFRIYASIVDYKRQFHISVSVRYNEVEDINAYNSDIENVGTALAKIALHAQIKTVRFLAPHFADNSTKRLIKSVIKNGVKVV